MFLEAFVGLKMPKLSSSLFGEIRHWTHLGVQSETDLLLPQTPGNGREFSTSGSVVRDGFEEMLYS